MGLANDVHNALSSAALVERDSEFPFRNHLGASLLGHTCDRYLWYSFRWFKLPSHSARIQRIFNRGRSEEVKIINALRSVGLIISTTIPELCENLNLPVNTNSIDVMRGYGLNVYKPSVITNDSQIKANFPPHLGGSMDGILHVPANYVSQYGYFMPVEVKTHSQKSFMEAKRNDESMRWNKPQHFVQGNAYATETGCSHFLYVAENKNTDELYLRDEQAEASVSAINIARGSHIVYRQHPDESAKTQEKWRCTSCDYKNICKSKKYDEIAVNCRTCKHASPQQDGSWVCNALMTLLEKEKEIEIAENCPHYTRIV